MVSLLAFICDCATSYASQLILENIYNKVYINFYHNVSLRMENL